MLHAEAFCGLSLGRGFTKKGGSCPDVDSIRFFILPSCEKKYE